MNLWDSLDDSGTLPNTTVEAAQSKRPTEDAPTQQPMRAGIKPAQQRKPSGDQKKVRRQMAKNAAKVDTECSGCFLRVEIDDQTQTGIATIPSNGMRGKMHVPAHQVAFEAISDGDLLYWECPRCGYADSTYADDDLRKSLGVKQAADEHVAPTDHEAVPEWDTALYSDICAVCGWPITSDLSEYSGADYANGPWPTVWTHDKKNPVHWTDKRKTSSQISTTTSKESTAMTAQPTEAELLTALASATTLAEQTDLQARIEALRATRRESLAQRDSLNWDALGPVPASPYERAAHHALSDLPPSTASVRLGHTEATDWLDDVLPSHTADSVLSATARAEATRWYEGVWAPVKQDAQEFSVQANSAARRVGTRFGPQSFAAASVFLDQIRHLASREGITFRLAAFGEDPYDQPDAETTDTYVSDGRTSQPVGVDSEDTFDEWGIGSDANGKGDPKSTTTTGDAPSLSEGNTPETGSDESLENPNYGQTDVDKSTYDVGNTEDRAMTQKGSSRRTAGVDVTKVKIKDRADNTFTGETSDGTRVTFRLSAEDAKDVRSVMFGDLAMNFTGLEIEESDIVKGGSRTASEYKGGSPKEGDTATCHKGDGPIQFFDGQWMHLKKGHTGPAHNDVHPASKSKSSSLAEMMASAFGRDTRTIQTYAEGDPKSTGNDPEGGMQEGNAPETGHSEPSVQEPGEGASDASTWGKDPDSLSTGGEDGSNATQGSPVEGTPTHASLRQIGAAFRGRPVSQNIRTFATALEQMDSVDDTVAGVSGHQVVSLLLASPEVPAGVKRHLSAHLRPVQASPRTCGDCGHSLGDHGDAEAACEKCDCSGFIGDAKATEASRRTAAGSRPLYEIAADIKRNWPNVYFGAVPYLDALSQLSSMDDKYYDDDADTIVHYLLSNMGSKFRGPEAPRLKAELKALVGRTAKVTEGGSTCSVCGDKIVRDSKGESPRTWHHDNGEKHDHEAKPGSESKESAYRRTAGWQVTIDGKGVGRVWEDKAQAEQQVEKVVESGIGKVDLQEVGSKESAYRQDGGAHPFVREAAGGPFLTPEELEGTPFAPEPCARCGEKVFRSGADDRLYHVDSGAAQCEDRQGFATLAVRTAASDTGSCAECGAAISHDKDSRQWTHDNAQPDHKARPAKAATKTAGYYQYAPEWDVLEPGTPIRVGWEENARNGYFVRVEKMPGDIYDDARMVVFTETPGGPEDQQGLTYYRGEEEKPRPARTASRRTATYYCTTHDVYVGDGNRDTHSRDSCNIEQRKSKDAAAHYDGSGAWIAQVAGTGENVWSGNGVSFDTPEEAKAWIRDLSMRWFGFDMGRVVPIGTPTREPVDMGDPQITHNFRTGSRKTAGEAIMCKVCAAFSVFYSQETVGDCTNCGATGLDICRDNNVVDEALCLENCLTEGVHFKGAHVPSVEQELRDLLPGKLGHKTAALPRPSTDLSGGWARKKDDGSPEYWGGWQHGDTGQVVHMYRGKGNKVRFYDDETGQQVGPEQANVAPGIAWAHANGYHDPDLAGLGPIGGSLSTFAARVRAGLDRVASPGDTFSLSDAQNEDGEWIMSPEQIRSEMNSGPGGIYYDPYDDYDPYEASRKAAAVDADGFEIPEPTNTFPCERCGTTVERYRGQYNVSCPNCNAQYNAGGQRLRDDWAGNASNWDSEVGDMEGYEQQQLRYETSRTAMPNGYPALPEKTADQANFFDSTVEQYGLETDTCKLCNSRIAFIPHKGYWVDEQASRGCRYWHETAPVNWIVEAGSDPHIPVNSKTSAKTAIGPGYDASPEFKAGYEAARNGEDDSEGKSKQWQAGYQQYKDDRQAISYAKDGSKTAMPNPAEMGIEIGDIFYSSWGYDQTNIDFYEVTGLTGASVRLRPIRSRVTEGVQGGDYVTAVPGQFTGGEMLKRIQDYSSEPSVSLNSFSNAYLWDGKPKFTNNGIWGR